MNDKIFEKVNTKFEITIQCCTTVPNFSQSGELQFLQANLPKNILGWSIRTNET